MAGGVICNIEVKSRPVIKARWIVGAVAVGLIGMHVGPLLLTHSEQDACSFGNVSNEEYRSLLARASLGRWRPLVWNADAATGQLNQKYRELLPNSPDNAIKVAAAHAVLRALGAEFRRFEDDKSGAPNAEIQRMFRYQYMLDVNRLFYFAPVLRNAWIGVGIDNPFQSPKTGIGPGDLHITALLPNLLDDAPDVKREGMACPPVPLA